MSRGKDDPSKHYKGKVCRHHPELNGTRYISTGQCIACIKKANKAWHEQRKAMIAAQTETQDS